MYWIIILDNNKLYIDSEALSDCKDIGNQGLEKKSNLNKVKI